MGKNEAIYELIRRRMLDGEPMTVEKIYLPQAYVQGSTKQDFEGSLFCLIEKNVEIAYSHQEIEAILVEAEISELLNVPVANHFYKSTLSLMRLMQLLFYMMSLYIEQIGTRLKTH